MNEIWRDISGFEGLYQISNLARVRSVDRKVFDSIHEFRVLKGKILRQTISTDGYYRVSLSKNSKGLTKKVHRLLAIAFIEKVDNKLFVNHKDGNKLNNKLSNLEWVSFSENNKHAYDTGLKHGLMGAVNKRSKPIVCMDLFDNKLALFGSQGEAAKILNMHPLHVLDILKGRKKNMHGLIFKYM